MDHGRLNKIHAEDAWWVAQGDEVTGPHAFREVLTALLGGVSSIQVVHESLAHEEEVPWRTLHYRPLWLNPKAAMLWKAGCWIILGIMGYLLIWSLIPHQFHGIVNLVFLSIGFTSLTWLVLRLVMPLLRPHQPAVVQQWRRTTALRRDAWMIFKPILIGCGVLLVLGIAWVVISSMHLKPQAWIESARAMWMRFASTPAPPSAPAESTASSPELNEPVALSAPEEIKPLAPTDKESDAPVPVEGVDLATLAHSPAQWPKSVTLKEAVSFPLMFNGKVAGMLKMPAGSTVKLTGMKDDQLTVLYQNTTQTIPEKSTDLQDRVRAARSSSSQGSVVHAAARNGMEPRTAARIPTASTSNSSSQEQIPSLPPQSESYFKSVRK